MHSKITEKKKSYVLPFKGSYLSAVNFKDYLSIELTVANSNLSTFIIAIFTNFELIRFNRSEKFEPFHIESAKAILNLVGLEINHAKCTKSGELQLFFSDKTQIFIPDAEFESWHISKIVKERVINSWIIGGVGATSIFDQ